MRKDRRQWLSPYAAVAIAPPPAVLRLPVPVPEPLRAPAGFTEYRALLHATFDREKRRLAEAASADPALLLVCRRWRPGEPAHNRRLLEAAFERLSAMMGGIYRFRPASLGHDPAMRGHFGRYDYSGVVLVSACLLNEPVGEVVDTLIHEQIHRLQHAMTEALAVPGRRALSPAEVCLARYWEREEPLAQTFYTRALGPEDVEAYRRLGKEYHAFDTAEDVTAHVMASLADEAI